MQRLFLFTVIFIANMMAMNAATKQIITRIDPTDWYVGLKNPTVQLMVYGKGIRDAQEVTTDYPGVTIENIVRLDSPNYLLVYLNLKDAKPGTMKLTFQVKNEKGKVKSEVVDYQLKQREMSGDKRQGFDISDVLYLLMPDRFAQGANHQKQIKGMRTYKEDRNAPSLRHGGDLEGLQEHLDYFTDLGVTALLRLFWRTTRLTRDSGPPTTAMPARTTTVWTPALVPMSNIAS